MVQIAIAIIHQNKFDKIFLMFIQIFSLNAELSESSADKCRCTELESPKNRSAALGPLERRVSEFDFHGTGYKPLPGGNVFSKYLLWSEINVMMLIPKKFGGVVWDSPIAAGISKSTQEILGKASVVPRIFWIVSWCSK